MGYGLRKNAGNFRDLTTWGKTKIWPMDGGLSYGNLKANEIHALSRNLLDGRRKAKLCPELGFDN